MEDLSRLRSPLARLATSLVSLAALLLPGGSQAFITTKDTQGHTVRWDGNSLKFNLVGNSNNRNNLSSEALFSAVIRSLARWNSASLGAITFDYWQGTEAREFETSSEFDGRSSLYFASSATAPIQGMNENVLGITQVWYDTKTGEILETDIALNDLEYQFTTRVSDTSSFLGNTQTGSRPSVFIENVLTHELGHALGLSHSGSLQSTMLFVESPEQARPSCDDQAGIRSLYSRESEKLSLGRMQGRVLSPGLKPVFGAQVSAVSLAQGTVIASTLSDANGNFEIPELPAGTYSLLLEPYYAGAGSLPAHYAGINSRVCPDGKSFARTIITESAQENLPRLYSLENDQTLNLGTLSVRCTGSAYLAAVPQEDPGLDFSNSAQTTAYSKFPPGSTRVIPLGFRSGNLQIRSLSFSLYSPVSLKLALTDSQGNKVTTQTVRPVYASQSGYKNYDSALRADNLPPDEYSLVVESNSDNGSAYPAGSVALDSEDFALITVGDTTSFGTPDARAYTPNSRCTQEETPISYQSPKSLPARANGKSGGFGFCGSNAEASQGLPSPPLSTPRTLEILGWILTWFLPFLGVRCVNLARR